MPHAEIRLQAQQAMSLGSPLRAAEDSLRFLLKRRLPRNNPADHFRYIELESARIVETLRCLRDQYRTYFEEQGCSPMAEMYWVVVRDGVKDWAIMVLRSAAIEYVAASRVTTAQWKELFDFSGPFNDLFPHGEAAEAAPVAVDVNAKLTKAITALLPQTVFDQVIDGGPFGRDYQIYLAHSLPGRAFLLGKESFQDAIDRRLASWDAAQPWAEGLAALFEVTQQEVLAQFDALGADAKEAESQFVHLSDFHRIAHKHLMTLARGEIVAEASAKDRWPALLLELDQAGIVPDKTLEGIARQTLMASRRKGLTIKTWQESYASTARVSLEDGRVRTLRREVTHAIHNSAKKAAYQLGKVWSRKTVPAKKQQRASTASRAPKAKN